MTATIIPFPTVSARNETPWVTLAHDVVDQVARAGRKDPDEVVDFCSWAIRRLAHAAGDIDDDAAVADLIERLADVRADASRQRALSAAAAT